MALQWDVVEVDFGVPLGHEMRGPHPALVISNDSLAITQMAVVCPFTSTPRDLYAHEISVAPPAGGLSGTSILMVHQVTTIDCVRIVRELGHIADPVLKRQVREELEALFDFGMGMP